MKKNEFRFNNKIKIQDIIIFFSKITTKEILENIGNKKYSIHKLKKITIYRIDINEYFKNFFVESISINSQNNIIEKIYINFIEKLNHQPISACDTIAARVVSKITGIKPIEKSLSEIEFKFPWGRLNILYDIKTSSSTAILRYK